MGYKPLKFIAIKNQDGQPLMPTERAWELIAKGKGVLRFDRGLGYIQLLYQANGATQPIALGIDPGSKKEGYTLMSEYHTYLNLQADAVTWVMDAEEASTNARRTRRGRKCPCRQPRFNRSRDDFLPPSTKARWDWKLRIIIWLLRYYPITTFMVEDICAKTKKGCKKWNQSFSPLEVGKKYFYDKLWKLGEVLLIKGYDTYIARKKLGLKKLSNKMSNKFEAHCVDSWVLANMAFNDVHKKPDNKEMLYITPLHFHRRQLHVFQPSKGGIRKEYGGTMSMGLKRGTWVKHNKYGICYVGGSSKGKISLHEIETGERLTRNIKVEDCQILTYCSWRLWKEEPRNSPHD